MLKRRIITCLDVKNSRTVKGTNFINLKDCGDPIELAKYYSDQGCDELVFLDIAATLENRKTFKALIIEIAREINIPFSVGGGVTSEEDVYELLKAGADKVCINSAAIENPDLIYKLSQKFGSQCIVIAIDIKCVNDQWIVYKNGGNISTGMDAITWSKKVTSLGAGELLITTMDNDGTQSGFALGITSQIDSVVGVPVIASGGAGDVKDFIDLFQKTDISAGLAASIFHYGIVEIPVLKSQLSHNNLNIRL